MKEKLYSIGELADLAETTVRTIRYYTNEGLLPQPLMEGKYAEYTPSHLIRLQLIRRLKDAYLPLREIRTVMNSLDDAAVQEKLREYGDVEGVKELNMLYKYDIQPEASDALDYIHRVMREQESWRNIPQKNNPPLTVAQKRIMPARAQPYSNFKNMQTGSTQSWQRIELAPGVELNIQIPVDNSTVYRVEQLIALAKKLFQS